MFKSLNIIISILIWFLYADATLYKNDKSNSKAEKYKNQIGPKSKNVFLRNLVRPDLKAKDIIFEHAAYYEETSMRNFNGTVLGYVTPWNNHGYDVAKIFTSKFTHISPVWFEIQRKKKLQYEVSGKHNIDLRWLEKLKRNNNNIKIVPRVLFSNWMLSDLNILFNNKDEQIELINSLITVCKINKFNGVVLEIWLQVRQIVKDVTLIQFINFVAEIFNDNNFELLLTVPPARGLNGLFSEKHLNKLSHKITAFSLMTYDFSTPERPGPNSPIKWMEHCIKTLVPDSEDPRRSKILLGLNFYGYDYTVAGGGPIIGENYIKVLENYKGKLKFDNDSKENFFEVRFKNEKHLIFYPTLYSLSERIELARKLTTGISIWELGQGLDYFYDLF